MNGDDLNNDPEQKPSRWVINFFDWSEEKARTYPDCFEILERLVKPERQRWKTDENGNEIIGTYALRKPLPQKWWIYGEKRPALYETISKLDQVMVSCRVSKYVNHSIVKIGPIFDVATSVVIRSEYWEFAFLQSSLHNIWAWKYASTLESRIRYLNVDCIDTFPIPDTLLHKIALDKAGEDYYEYRRQLMFDLQIGLTQTYNLFHSNAITANAIIEKDKQINILQKHLFNTANTIPFEAAIKRLIKLRELHIQMDNTVLLAYGWTDISLAHNFHEVDYLPENDRIRFTIHPSIQKEILKRLFALNQQLHKTESADKFSDKKVKAKKDYGRLF